MTNLVIDIGNTYSKLAIFNNRSLLEIKQFNELNLDVVKMLLEEKEIENSIVSSVNHEIVELESLLVSKTNYVRFSGSSKTSVINRYKTPQTLGLDRYAAVVAAGALCPGENCLVIDAGSCITYDFIDADRNYLGGSITPGISMRFKAMNKFTNRLPLLEFNPSLNSDFGNDTSSAIWTGVQKSVIYEALGFIDSFNKKWNNINVLLCGGDVNFFDTELKNSIFAHALKTEPHLVLIGLNEVILYKND